MGFIEPYCRSYGIDKYAGHSIINRQFFIFGMGNIWSSIWCNYRWSIIIHVYNYAIRQGLISTFL